ncbi:MAG: hypothetical protein ABSC46_01590 [Candidatus Limnocylindrales bacterium]|jgi:hypothetical protein
MRAIGRLPAVVAAAAVALAAGALASLAPGSPLVSSCVGAGSGRAALIVQHGDGSVLTRCVSFGTATVTGEQLLNLSGVAWSGQSFGSYGQAVCALDSEPAHYTTCPGQESYWVIFVSRGGGAWQLSAAGISSLTLADGDAEGFHYVPAAGNPAAPPSPPGVCAAAGATAAATSAGRPATAAATAAPVATAGATDPGSSAVAAASGLATAPTGDATLPGAAVAGGSAGAASPPPGASPQAPAPASGAGLDPGLVVAALAGGGLAGLALLRLAVGRRRGT